MKQNFEIWELNGIPQDEPIFTADNIQAVRDFIAPLCYQDQRGNIRAEEGATVYCNDVEIPLSAIMSDEDFYSTDEWNKICGVTD